MYPKLIKLDSPKLLALLVEKGKLIEQGREKSKCIETYENTMTEVEKELQLEEAKVDISDLRLQGEEVAKEMDVLIAKMTAIKNNIYLRMKEQTPESLRTRYEELKELKESTETDRNKIAIKAQKYNDKLIPLGRKLMSPYLENEYEDYDTLQLKDGKIVATIFNHLEDYKLNFKKNGI